MPETTEQRACRSRTPGEWKAVHIAELRRMPVDDLHGKFSAPGWQYTTTRANDGGRPVRPQGEGWELNVDAGDGGTDVDGDSIEAYWRRRPRAWPGGVS